MQHTTPRIWLITGISSGLGKALAEAVIRHGDFVVGTFRQAEQVQQFNARYAGQALAVRMDVTQPDEVAAAFATIEQQFGRLDVLVNNAGFGFAGAVEEASEQEVREVFEANFFGVLRVTQAALPLLRRQRSGHVIQMSSHGGIKAFAGFGVYNAAKFAVEGLSEALAGEVGPLGIRLTIVEPGPFRTEFAAAAFRQAARSIDDYAATSGAFQARMQAVNGQQEGDPVRAAEAIWHISTLEQPPLRLPLGKVPMTTIQLKLDSVKKDLEDWRELAESVVF
jgi:NAD(P)-dependent dehydrogenase (short-subunit alcohol dehydrogenase family)